MATDPQVREEAHSRLVDLFRGIGSQSQGGATDQGDLGGIIGQVQEFMAMPANLAQIFIEMAVQLADTTLTALEEAGIELVKGMTPM